MQRGASIIYNCIIVPGPGTRVLVLGVHVNHKPTQRKPAVLITRQQGCIQPLSHQPNQYIEKAWGHAAGPISSSTAPRATLSPTARRTAAPTARRRGDADGRGRPARLFPLFDLISRPERGGSFPARPRRAKLLLLLRAHFEDYFE